MLKWLAVFAILLTLTPVPGKGVKPSAQSPNNVKRQSKSDQQPAPSPLAVKGVIQPVAADPHGKEVTREDKQNKVAVVSLPPVSVERQYKGWTVYIYDWGPWSFTGLLVVVGCLQVWLLRVTWKAIARQASLMKQMNDMTASRDRARLKIKITHQSYKTGTATEASGSPFGNVEFTINNIGPTHAVKVLLRASCFICDSAEPPFPAKLRRVHILHTIKANRRTKSEMPLEVRNVDGVFRGTEFMHLVGKLAYNDIFRKKPWTQTFHYIWNDKEWLTGKRITYDSGTQNQPPKL